MPELSIIIVSYNTKDLLKSCLDSLVGNLRGLDYEVIIVDNNSIDGTVGMLETYRKNKKEDLVLIFNKGNVGFSRANNQGIEKSTGKYILLLNPDTKLIDSSLLGLLEFAKITKDFGIGGPQLLNDDGSSQVSVFSDQSLINAVKEFWFGKKDAFMLRVPKNLDIPQQVYGLIGAALLIPRKIIEAVGVLEEKYFFYYEDLDYCRRIHEHDFKVYYFPEAKIVHSHGASSGKNREQAERSMVKGSKIYHGLIKYCLLYFILWSRQKLKRVFRI